MTHQLNDTNWLTEAYDYELPYRGQTLAGVLLELDDSGAVIDIGLKHDGIVPRRDLERLGDEWLDSLKPGQEVKAQVIRPVDQDGNLILSLYGAQAEQDWERAEAMYEAGDVWEGPVTGVNKGGVLVQFGHVQGFVPISHLIRKIGHGLSVEQRRERLSTYLGQNLKLKIIEVNPRDQRLIFSERQAKRDVQAQRMEELLDVLNPGDVVKGVIIQLTDFGAFVDLQGATGLIHISELAWRHVHHPGEVVKVGDEIEVAVLNLDEDRRRISLSLKQLQDNPWDRIQQVYTIGQIVSGTISNVVQFGAFVLLDIGLEGLVHNRELAEPEPNDAREFVTQGDSLVVKIINIDIYRQRIDLSLKQVDEAEPASDEAPIDEHGPASDETPDDQSEPAEA